MRTRIGTYTLTETTTFRNASYETAAWYSVVEVPAGEYDVMADVTADGMVDDNSIGVRLDGICVDAHFPSLFGGVPIGGGDNSDRYIGRAESYFLHPYAHALAEALLSGSEHVARYTLDSSFVAVPVHFTSTDGVPTTTHKIRTIDYREPTETLLARLNHAHYSLGRVDAEDDNNPPPDYMTGGGYRGDGTGSHPGLSKAERRRNILAAIETLKREVMDRLAATV